MTSPAQVGTATSGPSTREAFGWAGAVVRPFVTLNWWHDALGDEVVVNNVSTRYLYPSDRFEFKAGVDARFQGGWMAWGNVGWQTGSQSYQAWTVQAGTRFRLAMTPGRPSSCHQEAAPARHFASASSGAA